MNRARIKALGGLLLCAAFRPLFAQPSFTGIGNLHGGNSMSHAVYVSADGVVTLGYSGIPAYPPTEVVRWTQAHGMMSITPGVYSKDPGGSSGIGAILAGNFIHPNLRTTEAFRWTAATGAIALGDLPGGEFRSGVRGVSARGDVLVGYSSSHRSGADSVEAFRWTAATGMVGLGDLPDGIFASGATAISVDGRVIVGGGWSDLGMEAIRWTPENGIVGLGDLPDGPRESVAEAVSADGSIVVGTGWDREGQRAFRWTAQAGIVALDKIHPDQNYQRAYGASWDCNVIVGETAVFGGAFGPFYWTAEDGTQWLTDVFARHGVIVPDGWHLGRASAVSADGRTIVGTGVNPQNVTEGWVAYLGPACRADYDEDGSVTTADVMAYLSVWTQRSIFADWNYDGFIDTRDLIGFLEEWAAGC